MTGEAILGDIRDDEFGDAISFGEALGDSAFGEALGEETFGDVLGVSAFGEALGEETFGEGACG